MAFPQLMPDTFSVRKRRRKENANELGQSVQTGCLTGLRSKRRKGVLPWTLIKVIQQQQLEHHTSLYHPTHTQLPSTALELTGTFRGAAAGPGTIISVTNAEQQHLSDHSLD